MGGTCDGARGWVLATLTAAAALGCAPAPEEAALGYVRRLGGRAASIRRLDLAHTSATDADLAMLAAVGGGALAGVEELDLTHTGITDVGLSALRSFPNVKKLSLTLTGITDAGLPALAALEQLADLYLIETAITDAAVEPLSGFARLRTLVLLRTAVSEAGIVRLRQALPSTAIQIEPAGGRGRRAVR
jgi:hypothetical protein